MELYERICYDIEKLSFCKAGEGEGVVSCDGGG